MDDTSRATLRHAARARRERIRPAVVARRVRPLVEVWAVPGEPVPFAEAVVAPYRPVADGEPWGPPWGTAWFRVMVDVPAEWPDEPVELVVDLGFTRAQPGFQAEGLVFDERGRILKAIEPRNAFAPLPDASPGRRVVVHVEAAANPDIGADWRGAPTPLGSRATAGDAPLYVFGGVEAIQRDPEVAALERDWTVLLDLVRKAPLGRARRARALAALDAAGDRLDPDDVRGTAAAARAALAPVLASPAEASAHRVSAIGHAHIDSAWLWPVRETVRKVARTFSNVLDLMERYPDVRFAASSAQQYAWVRDAYPQLFERIRERVREGRWIPVGRMWVESDTNMPGGESMVRQFLHGVRFFEEELGSASTTVWLPDSFGYSAALPQIALGAGGRAFLTQKPSWNDTNVLPHRSFLWEGIDGSRILTHLPPVDSYSSDLGARDLARAERQHAEAGASDRSLVPFGHGDGGGGPTRQMVETGLRKADLEGSPRVSFDDPDAFFDAVRTDLVEPPVWSGEMYLEFHRGTLTSQARTKAGNRRCEALLREAELWATTATIRTGAPYPADALRAAWETVLLQQFHDILPGSAIAWVHEEAERRYAEVEASLEALIAAALAVLAGGGTTELRWNASPFPIDGVPPFGTGPAAPPVLAPARRVDDGWLLEGSGLAARFDDDGLLVGLVDRRSNRELVPDGTAGNELQLFRDVPNKWDAWDVDRSYQRTRLGPATTVAVEADGDALVVRRRIGGSAVDQRISIAPHGRALDIETRVDWREERKLLKLAFPLDVAADRALSEIQFGHVTRPTHVNTSWDVARFETVAHRWLRVEDGRHGCTIANDRTYGHDVTRVPGRSGGTTALVRETLLRAARFPDPRADRGVHVFRHAVAPGDRLEGIAEGYRLQLPLRTAPGRSVDPLVRLDPASGILVEAVKLAEDGSGDVVVRCYEALGGAAEAVLELGFPADRVVVTDLLERPVEQPSTDPLRLALRAFEIVTLRITRRAAAQ